MDLSRGYAIPLLVIFACCGCENSESEHVESVSPSIVDRDETEIEQLRAYREAGQYVKAIAAYI